MFEIDVSENGVYNGFTMGLHGFTPKRPFIMRISRMQPEAQAEQPAEALPASPPQVKRLGVSWASEECKVYL